MKFLLSVNKTYFFDSDELSKQILNIYDNDRDLELPEDLQMIVFLINKGLNLDSFLDMFVG